MTGVSFIFDTSALAKVQHLVAGLKHFNEDTQPTMLAIARVGEQKSQERFSLQRAPDGSKWLPSAAATKEKRKTLIKTTHFQLDTFSSEATADIATWGTNAVQGRIFQLGGVIKREAREGKVRLRLKPDGSLMRQTGFERLARFAKASHKRAKEVDYKAKAYDITVIARPYLGVDDEDRNTFTGLYLDRFNRFLHDAGLGGS